MSTPAEEPGYAPSSGLVGAILVTIFCCLPFGIVAIVKASQVNALWAGGQYAAARKAAESASSWTIAAIFTGLALGALSFFLEYGGNL